MDRYWIVDEFRWAHILLLALLIYIGWRVFLLNWIYPILLGTALIPGILYLNLVRLSDVDKIEPLGVIALQMIIGILLIYPAIFFEGQLIQLLRNFNLTPAYNFSPSSLFFWIVFALLIVAPVEEGLKFAGTFLGNYLHQENDEPSDTVVYCVAVAAGFALFENYRYIFGNVSQLGLNDAFILAIARSFTAIPLHLGVAMTMGAYLSAYYNPEQLGFHPSKKSSFLLKAFTVPVLIHGIYDLIVFLLFFNFYLQVTAAIIYVIIISLYTWFQVQELRKRGLD